MSKETTQFNRKQALELAQKHISNMTAHLQKGELDNTLLNKVKGWVRQLADDYFNWLEQANTEDETAITPSQVDYLNRLLEESTFESHQLSPAIKLDDLNRKGAGRLIEYYKDHAKPKRLSTQKAGSELQKQLNDSIKRDGK